MLSAAQILRADGSSVSPFGMRYSLFKGIVVAELECVELFIGAACRHQLLVGAALGDMAVHHDGDLVGVADGGETVRDDEGGASLAELVECLLDEHLGGVIECTGCFVQNQNGGILEENACDAQSLLLTARKLDAALTDLGVVALFKGHDVFVDVGAASRLVDLLLGGVGTAVEDVFADGADKEEDVLLDDADVAADGFKREVADVLSVDQHGAAVFVQMVEVGEQVAERRLTAARGADERELTTLFELQVDVVQNLLAFVVGEGDVSELNGAVHVFKLVCVGGFLFGCFIHDLDETFEAADAVLELLHEGDQGVDGADEEVDGNDEGGIVTEGDAACIEEETARDQNEHVENLGHEGGGGVELRHGVIGAAGGVDEGLVPTGELFHLAVGVGVCLGDADAGDTAFHCGVDDGVAGATVIEGALHGLAEVHRDHHENGNAGKDDQRQDRVDGEQIDEGEDDHDRADEQVFGAVMRQLADLKEVTGDTGHDAAGLVVVVETEGKLLQMVEEILAHLRLHLNADDVPVILNEIAQKHTDHVEREDDHTRDDDGGIHLFGDVDVKHISRHDGVDHADDRDQECRQHIEQEHFLVGLVVFNEAFQHEVRFPFFFVRAVRRIYSAEIRIRNSRRTGRYTACSWCRGSLRACRCSRRGRFCRDSSACNNPFSLRTPDLPRAEPSGAEKPPIPTDS